MSLYCGDYFEFDAGPFDALYDRGALVAVDPDMRGRYVESTRKLLRSDAYLFLVTMEYDQSIVAGPPFALMPDELATYFSGLERLDETDDLDNCPPKFREIEISYFPSTTSFLAAFTKSLSLSKN